MHTRLLVFSLVFFSIQSFSQPFRWNDVSLIMQGAGYHSTILNPQYYTEEIDGVTPTLRFSGGVGLMYNYTENWAVSLTTDYQRKGQRFERYMRGETVARDYKIDYLDVNLMGKYFTDRYVFGFGGYAGFLVREELRFKHDVMLGTQNFFNANRYKDLDYGLQAEVGVLLDLDYRTKATLSLFAMYGLTDINNERFQFDLLGEEYNSARNLIVGLRFTVYIITQPF
jgi:hypothetical protein